MLTTARHPKPARVLLAVLAVIMIATAVAFIRPVFGFGLLFTIVTGATLGAITYAAPAWASVAVLQFMGLLSMVYVIVDIKADIVERHEQMSDATLLAAHTGIPSIVWGLAWIAIAIALSGAFLRDACMPTRAQS